MTCYSDTDLVTLGKKTKKLGARNQPTADQQRRLADAVASGDWSAYSRIAVAFSGGKDSLAMPLRLLALGCPAEKMVLMHHDIDGREGSDLYDWAITRDYCRKVADHLGIELRFSWLVGGFERELMRDGTPKAAIRFELGDGTIGETGGTGKPNTRRRHPAKVANLQTRWCSSSLKIDVGAAAIRNDPDFNGDGPYLVVTGERREESAGRSGYAEIEAHRTNCQSRDVTHWRPVLDLGEAEIWDTIKASGIVPHPAYRLGFGRVSCAFCIFASAGQLATLRSIMPERFARHAQIEIDLDHTVDNKRTLVEMADSGAAYAAASDGWLISLATAETYEYPIHTSSWKLPAGAFGDSSGPV